MNRRDFLKMIGLGGLGAAVGAGLGLSNKSPGDKLIPYVVPPEDVIPGVGTWYASLCTQCSAGCGIHVKSQEGRAKKIEGNPDHPVNKGGLCALGQAGLQTLYNPDRIKTPLRRKGKRGLGDFEEISWQDANAILASKLAVLEEDSKTDSFYLLSNIQRGHLGRLFNDFMASFGSSNRIDYALFQHANVRQAASMSLALDDIPHFDIANTKLLLNFGADFASTWLSPVQYSHALGQMRGEGRNGRGRLIQVEPRMSLTGASADKWVPIKPGAEGVLALSLSYAIVEKGLYKGPDAGSWKSALRDYRPKRASALTEISEKTIYAIAEEFAGTRASLAIGGENVSSYANGLSSQVAINVLNYVGGNIGKKGGVVPNPAGFLSGAKGPESKLSNLIKAASAGKVGALLTHNVNPFFTTPSTMKTKEAFANIPFIASMTSFMDETAKFADLILPVNTYLEDWGDDFPEPGASHKVATIMQPVVVPLYNTRSAGDVILELARVVGKGSKAGKFKAPDFKSYLEKSWHNKYKKDFATTEVSFALFWNKLLQRGGIWKESHTRLAAHINPASIKKSLPSGPARFAGDEKTYPYYLMLYAGTGHLDGSGANLPWIQELPSPMTSVVWGSWVEINPKTAKGLGLKEGDVVEVASPYGSIKAPIYLFPGIRPDTISIPIGQGHSSYGRYASGRGANPIELLPYVEEPKTGNVALNSTRVKIARVKSKERLVKLEGSTDEMGRGIVQTITPAELKDIKRHGGAKRTHHES